MTWFLGITSHVPKTQFQEIVSGSASCSKSPHGWQGLISSSSAYPVFVYSHLGTLIGSSKGGFVCDFACDNQGENAMDSKIHWIHHSYQNSWVNLQKRHVSLKQHFFYSSFRFFFVRSHCTEQRSRITNLQCNANKWPRFWRELLVFYCQPLSGLSGPATSNLVNQFFMPNRLSFWSETNTRGYLYYVNLKAGWLMR